MKTKETTKSLLPRQIESLVSALDDFIKVPGTNIRVGIDGLIGLIPGVGDFATACFSVYILYIAAKIGAPVSILFRMFGNIFLDAFLGAVPLFGDLFDIAFKSNRRNLILLTALDSSEFKPRDTNQIILYLRLGALIALLGTCLLIYLAIHFVLKTLTY